MFPNASWVSGTDEDLFRELEWQASLRNPEMVPSLTYLFTSDNNSLGARWAPVFNNLKVILWLQETSAFDVFDLIKNGKPSATQRPAISALSRHHTCGAS